MNLPIALSICIFAGMLTVPWWGVNSEGAIDTLTAQGYTDITTHGYGWLSCGGHDLFRTRFEASSVNGTRVSGAVCEGIFKGKLD